MKLFGYKATACGTAKNISSVDVVGASPIEGLKPSDNVFPEQLGEASQVPNERP